MKRREFVTLIGGAAAWSIAARAQQSGKLPTIGYLGASTPADAAPWTAAFVQRLRELGWVEGRTVAIEYRWGEARSDRWAEITAEFVRLKVDVIATYNTPTTLTAKKVTSAVPIVFALAADPVGSGLVASLRRPGGNVTGMSTQHADFPGKRLALLREIVPGLRRLAVMANVGNSASVREMAEVQLMARTLGLDFVALEIRGADDIDPALEALNGRVRRALSSSRRAYRRQSGSHQRRCSKRASADDVRLPGICPRGRPDVIWAKLPRSLSALCRLGR